MDLYRKSKGHVGGSWNIEGILKQHKRPTKKAPNYKPTGAAAALSKKLLAEKKKGNDK